MAKKKHGDLEILRIIALKPAPVVTAPELAEETRYGPDGARQRLKDLQEKGLVDCKDVGARSVVWWITPEGKERLNDAS